MKKLNITVAIVAVLILATVAVLKGIDGAVLISAFTILGGLGGYEIGKKKSG
ncbi:hypothetical protein ES703_116040 [subsurface metagenome]